MKSLSKFLVIVASVSFSCSDEKLEFQTSRENIQAELNIFTMNAKTQGLAGDIYMNKVVAFLTTKGFRKMDRNNPDYEERKQQALNDILRIDPNSKVNCELDYYELLESESCDCYVFVMGYGNGCADAGCAANFWYNRDGTKIGEMLIC